MVQLTMAELTYQYIYIHIFLGRLSVVHVKIISCYYILQYCIYMRVIQ